MSGPLHIFQEEDVGDWVHCQDPFNFGNLFLVVTLRFPEVQGCPSLKDLKGLG